MIAGKTILQVVPALDHGGVEQGTLEIAEKIVSLGGRSLQQFQAYLAPTLIFLRPTIPSKGARKTVCSTRSSAFSTRA